MKRLKTFVSMTIFLIVSSLLHAQESKYSTESFHVDGVCDMCKTRIENAAYIKGVKHCEWDKESKVLTVVFNPEKIELIKIHESIARAGHSTDRVEADEEAYHKLPRCCNYKDGTHVH